MFGRHKRQRQIHAAAPSGTPDRALLEKRLWQEVRRYESDLRELAKK